VNFEDFGEFLEKVGHNAAAGGIKMEKIVDAFVTIVCFFVFSAGGSFAAKKTFRYVQTAALEKAAHGLPPLPRFKRN